jgi:hypothetical protein
VGGKNGGGGWPVEGGRSGADGWPPVEGGSRRLRVGALDGIVYSYTYVFVCMGLDTDQARIN